uniref:Protein phosphatase inhibitor 2 n=1 Tax=Tanacetum cinerariifolium TaxID=118510 RepID=A0A699HU16_TANCI|nr:protein phosphatase inhibitor 2 [Tanacetum cinerariifolium]
MSPVRKSCLYEKDDHDTKCFESILLLRNDMVSANSNNNPHNSCGTTSDDEADPMDEENEGSLSNPQ